MKYIIQLGLILLIFCAVASGVLAFVNSKTQPVIAARKALEEEQTRKELMPDAKVFEEKVSAEDSTFIYYIAKDDKDMLLGYCFIAAKRGYSSVIRTMVAMDDKFTIINMKVIDQNETPGLGTLCQDKAFSDRFQGKGFDDLKADKDGGTIQSITGATITTRAVIYSLQDAILMLKEDLEAAEPIQNTQTEAKPLDKKALRALKNRLEVLPEAKTFVEMKALADTNFIYYIAKDSLNNSIGYTFEASKQGYCSEIILLAALDNELNIKQIKVLNQDETPALGAECQEGYFLSRFNGKGADALKVDKDGGMIKSIAGATITTRAITNCLRDTITKLKAELKARNTGGSK